MWIFKISFLNKLIVWLLKNIPFSRELIELKPEPTFKLAIMIRVLYLPLGLKEYLVVLLGFPYLVNAITSLIISFMNALLFTSIGLNLNNFEEIFSDKPF